MILTNALRIESNVYGFAGAVIINRLTASIESARTDLAKDTLRKRKRALNKRKKAPFKRYDDWCLEGVTRINRDPKRRAEYKEKNGRCWIEDDSQKPERLTVSEEIRLFKGEI